MIAHRLKTVRHADQIFVIDNGGIAQKGTHEELIAQTGILYSLFEQCIIHLLSPFELLFFRFFPVLLLHPVSYPVLYYGNKAGYRS